jgi:hypothetical protein
VGAGVSQQSACPEGARSRHQQEHAPSSFILPPSSFRSEEIVALETELNERVYRLFDLTDEEIRIIEESTKYRYGEV